MRIDRKELTGNGDLGTSALGLAGNIVWFIFAGIWLAIGHVISAVLNAMTIIGIPFAIQHLKLAGCALAPVGKTVVSKEGPKKHAPQRNRQGCLRTAIAGSRVSLKPVEASLPCLDTVALGHVNLA